MIERIKVTGGCHCGAVRFEALSDPRPTLLDCNCSICAASGYLHLFIPHKHFTLLSGQERLTSYRFGTGEANHLFCNVCGVKSFYQPKSHPSCWSVNLNCLDNPRLLDPEIAPFDGRNWDEAAAREGLR